MITDRTASNHSHNPENEGQSIHNVSSRGKSRRKRRLTIRLLLSGLLFSGAGLLLFLLLTAARSGPEIGGPMVTLLPVDPENPYTAVDYPFNQKGELFGTITDADNGEGLIGATVLIEELQQGTSTDMDGKFSITEIEPGKYTVRVTYIGYQEHKVKGIELLAGKRTELSLAMESDQVQIEEIVIAKEMSRVGRTKGKRGQTEISMPAPAMEMDAADVMSFQSSGAAAVYPNVHVTPAEHNTEEYAHIYENGFKDVIGNPLSTFSIDVDAASYANMRRFINSSQEPPVDAVRIEELVNYFDYDYTQPLDNHPFNVITEISDCPWNAEAKVIHIGLQGKEIDYSEAAASNLVFLIDVSGSMGQANKLPLVQASLMKLVDNLDPKDRIALVVYSGAAGEVLASTPASEKDKIKNAIGMLRSGGSTAGGAGIKLAYKIAQRNLIEGGNNRVILCTDGDFNVGASSNSDMVRLIEEKRKSGVFITVCGFGMGNYKDSKMEQIADKGNGNYYYIDSDREAEKVFVTEMRATLFTIAKDVKIQVEFNPIKVKEYRLIGYENRILNKEDFDDDTKDAGELGAGHTVTALYEVVLHKQDGEAKGDQGSTRKGQKNLPGEELKYQHTTVKPEALRTDEIITIKLRYKKPDGTVSQLIEHPLVDQRVSLEASSDNFRWSAAVASFGMLLRDSEHKGTASYAMVLNLAQGAVGGDIHGYRAEFIDLVKKSSKGLATR